MDNEPIEGFYGERGRIFIDIQGPVDAFILAKLKAQQLKQQGAAISQTAALEEEMEIHKQEIIRVIHGNDLDHRTN